MGFSTSFEEAFGKPTAFISTDSETILFFADPAKYLDLKFADDATDWKKQPVFCILKIAADPNNSNFTVFSAPNGSAAFNHKPEDYTSLNYKPLTA